MKKGQISSQVDAFLDKRPHYDREHVEEIAQHCAKEGIPFCGGADGCKDWHRPEDAHSYDEENPG